jgi:DNA polymerase sigma
MFQKIYSLYSTDDMVQVIDIISTQDDISKRRYKNTNIKSKLVQIELEIGNKKPYHNELWLFGDESNILYRKHLAINPLPVFVFAPVIINEIENKHPGVNDLLAHIDKDKSRQCFTVKLKDKALDQNQTLTSMPAQIMAFNNANPDK